MPALLFERKNEPRINATARPTSSNDFGLRLRLDGGLQQMTEDILLPKWDGEDVFEGMLIFAARENPAEFSEWLRLTSLVCNQYRQCARAHYLSQNGMQKNSGST